MLALFKSIKALFLLNNPLRPLVLTLKLGREDVRLNSFKLIFIFSSTFKISPLIKKLNERNESSKGTIKLPSRYKSFIFTGKLLGSKIIIFSPSRSFRIFIDGLITAFETLS